MARKPYTPDVVLGHADEADGIEEYDNRLPNWWLGLFYVTIVIGVWIFLEWHVLGSKSLAELYQAEMQEAHERYAALIPQPPSDVPLTAEAAAAGAELFRVNCAACHAEDGTGRVGPNLTDSVWIHGGTPVEIAATIFNGVPDRGMVTWGPVLGSERVAQLAAYVHGLGGGVPVGGSGAAPAGRPASAAPPEGSGASSLDPAATPGELSAQSPGAPPAQSELGQ